MSALESERRRLATGICSAVLTVHLAGPDVECYQVSQIEGWYLIFIRELTS